MFPTLADGNASTAAEESSLGFHMINVGNTSEISEYCASLDITPSTLLQFAWALVLRSYTGSDEVIFGYLSSGRDIPVANIEHGVGAFINMLVCRLQLNPDAELGEALETMQADLAAAMAHQSSSLAEIQHELQLPALFDTAFTYQKRAGARTGHHQQQDPRRSAQSMGLQYRVVSAEDPSEYKVAVNVEATQTALEIHFSYWKNFISDAQMQNVAATFEQVLRDLVAGGERDDDRAVGEVDLVGPSVIQQVAAWNNYELPCIEQCVHDMIGWHAQQRPLDTPAVCGWDASFTYQELDRAAAALARHLVDAHLVWGLKYMYLSASRNQRGQ